MQYINTHKHTTSYFKYTLTFLCPAKRWKSISATRKNLEILAVLSSESATLYVGLEHADPLIQNSSRYFSRLKWTYSTQTLTSTEHHISSLHLHFWVELSGGSPFRQPDKKGKFMRFFIIIIIILIKIFSHINSDEISPSTIYKYL